MIIIKLKVHVLLAFNILSLSILAQIGINPTGSNPDASAGLDINFSDKGLLIPRVSLT